MLSSVFLVLLFLSICSGGKKLPKEAYETVPQLISSAGYPVSQHEVTTEDGYILQLFRIPAGRKTTRSESAKGKRAILLMHGMTGGCDNFIILGPNKSLGYMLADAGYDVWLGNMRGTSYSHHQNVTKADFEFWNFSFEEHGKYDLPAIIDKILSVTKEKKITYLGHSMGGTSFFVMMSEKPEYNKHIVAFIGFGPAVYIHTIKTRNNIIAKNLNKIIKSPIGQNITRKTPWTTISASSCQTLPLQRNKCAKLVSYIMGQDYEQIDMKIFPTAMARLQPASWKELAHYDKIAKTDVFTAYGDGTINTIIPYKLSNVKVPVVLMYGQNDIVVPPYQVFRLAKELRGYGIPTETYSPAWPKFNHVDYLFAKDIVTLLNKPVINMLNKMYENA